MFLNKSGSSSHHRDKDSGNQTGAKDRRTLNALRVRPVHGIAAGIGRDTAAVADVGNCICPTIFSNDKIGQPAKLLHVSQREVSM